MNWGILAPGHIARKFAEDLQYVPEAKLAAVGSRSMDRAIAFAEEFGVEKAYGSYEELVQDPNVGVIYIASPHSEHYEHTMLCLNAGKPVLCEKAFAFNTRQVKKMTAAAREKGLFLMEAIWTRFHPAIQQTLDIIQSGQIGKIVHIQADFGFKAEYDTTTRLFNRDLAGGSLYDIGLYPLFISKLLLGIPSEIRAVGTLTETGVDMNCTMALNYGDGATASLFSTFAAQTDTTCTIYGTSGQLFIQSRFHETTGLTLYPGDGMPESISTERKGWGYSYEAEHVQECIRQGLIESPLLPHSFSIELMESLEEVRHQLGVWYPGDERYTDN
ncbi:MAG: Gfo/Idh/MocA family oxidoreductase [Siphonobacter sp.]